MKNLKKLTLIGVVFMSAYMVGTTSDEIYWLTIAGIATAYSFID